MNVELLETWHDVFDEVRPIAGEEVAEQMADAEVWWLMREAAIARSIRPSGPLPAYPYVDEQGVPIPWADEANQKNRAVS